MNETNTSVESRKRKMFIEEIKEITNAFEDLNAEVGRLRNEKKDILSDIRIQKRHARNFPIKVALVNGLTLIALYEITKKVFNKWIW